MGFELAAPAAPLTSRGAPSVPRDRFTLPVVSLLCFARPTSSGGHADECLNANCIVRASRTSRPSRCSPVCCATLHVRRSCSLARAHRLAAATGCAGCKSRSFVSSLLLCTRVHTSLACGVQTIGLLLAFEYRVHDEKLLDCNPMAAGSRPSSGSQRPSIEAQKSHWQAAQVQLRALFVQTLNSRRTAATYGIAAELAADLSAAHYANCQRRPVAGRMRSRPLIGAPALAPQLEAG